MRSGVGGGSVAVDACVRPGPGEVARGSAFRDQAVPRRRQRAHSPQDAERILAPYTGPDRSLADIQRAREALEAAYSAKGYGAVQVLLPEQEVARGEVVLRAVEAKLGKVTVEGNRFFDEPNIRASLPSLQPGSSPNTARSAKDLRVANENPSKQTTVTLRSGATEGEVDAVVRVVDQDPLKFMVSVDNTGTPQTGDWRIGAGVQHSNLWNRDHILNFQYVTAPYQEGDPDPLALPPNKDVEIWGASYRVPIYSLGDSLDLDRRLRQRELRRGAEHLQRLRRRPRLRRALQLEPAALARARAAVRHRRGRALLRQQRRAGRGDASAWCPTTPCARSRSPTAAPGAA